MFSPLEAYAFGGGIFMKGKVYLFCILLTQTAGAAVMKAVRNDITQFAGSIPQSLVFPFPAGYTILFFLLLTLMGISAARFCLASPKADRQIGINLYICQLIFLLFWNLLFFHFKIYGLAFYWLMVLWLLLLLMLLAFRQSDKISALLSTPCFLWITYCGMVNFIVWQLNR